MPPGTMSARAREQDQLRELPVPVAAVSAAPAGEDHRAVCPPVYAGDVWGLRIWLAGAGILVFLHITEMLGRILR
jgi:hypothetical protein